MKQYNSLYNVILDAVVAIAFISTMIINACSISKVNDTLQQIEQCNQNDEGAIKVLTGITSTAATKNVTLTKGADEIHSIDVAITVTPDKRS